MAIKRNSRRTFIKNAGIFLFGLSGSSYVSLQSESKKITLLGDSIRKGYQPYVSLFLPDHVTVWGPEENTQHSVHLLANSPRWIKDRPADLIHLNAGLHDIKNIPFQARRPLISVEQYAENIERIIKFIHNCWPECVIIWCTTTPVNDENAMAVHEEAQDFSRYNEDVIKYNEISKKVVERLGVPVNDLYAYVMKADKDLIMKKDGVHFTDFGNELLGEQVADSIRLFIN
jgi:lysophospholipase L1-like esterase